MAYNTGNSVPSTDPRDLYDNAQNLDNLVNGESPDYQDRLGKTRKSWAGMEQDFADFLAGSAYEPLGDYEAGIEVTRYNQVIRDGGEFWRASADTELPYTTTGAGMPESGAFVSVGDAVLRQDLAEQSGVGFGTDLVGHDGGTARDAINQRTIYVGSVAELEAISSPVDGQEVIGLGTPFVWSASDSEWKASGPINVKLFGAVGDGATDDRAAIKDAVDFLKEGDTLYFPPGHYYTDYLTHTDITNWILVQENGVTLRAEPGTVRLENFLISVNGSFSTPIDVGSSGFTSGDNLIDTALPHGLSDGDVVQFLSQINSYSTDAGDFQLGSRNPTSNILFERRFSEIHKVQEVVSSTSFSIDGAILYPNYSNDISGLSDPMTDVTSAQIRKINPVLNAKIYGIIFKNDSTSSFRGIFAQGVYGLEFEECGFIAKGLPGVHVRTQNSCDIRFVNCWERRSPDGASGSSWNSFVIGGGSQEAFFSDCTFNGGEQVIDFSPGTDETNPFYLADDKDGLTVQNIGVHNCKFDDCADSATSHPGTYICSFSNNVCINVNNGFRGRSKKMSIQGNIIKANNAGVVISAFYDDTTISGNNISQVTASRFSAPIGWTGVSIVPMSSETMNNNDLKNIVISGNSIRSTTFNVGDMGVLLRHVGDGTPPSGSFTEFTDTVKTNLSRYIITGNSFYQCGVRVSQFINGVSCIQNNFDRCAQLNAYFESSSDSARHRVGGNYFDGVRPTNSVIVRAPASLTYGYATQHAVSGNQHPSQALNNSLADSGAFNTD